MAGGATRTARNQRAAAVLDAPQPEQQYVDLCDQARVLLDEGRAGEAVLAARRALEAAPRGRDGQRLLGLAHLAQGEARLAIGALQRALACDPLDVVAQVGTAEAQEALGGPGAAEPEWLRAWELQPGVPAVAERLGAARAAAGARDVPGDRPYTPPLTRPALARIYLRGGRYEHAAAEARAVLAREPDRPDVQVLLAEACWRAGDGESAAGIASSILDRLPDCVAANLLLADHWHRIGRDPGDLLVRVQAVDPVGAVAARLFDDREAPPLFAAAPAEDAWHRVPPPGEPGAAASAVPEAALGATQLLPVMPAVPVEPPPEPAAPRAAVPAEHVLVQEGAESAEAVLAAAPPDADHVAAEAAPLRAAEPRETAAPVAPAEGIEAVEAVDSVGRAEAVEAIDRTESAPAPLVRDWLGGPVAAAATPPAEAEAIGAPGPLLAPRVPGPGPGPGAEAQAPLLPAAPPAAAPAAPEPPAVEPAAAQVESRVEPPVEPRVETPPVVEPPGIAGPAAHPWPAGDARNAQEAGDQAMREGRYLDAIYAYGSALRAMRAAQGAHRT